MKKFWIAFDKKNSRCLFQSEDREKTEEWAKSHLAESPSRGQLFILEAISIARLTAAPVEVVYLMPPLVSPKREEGGAEELVDRLRKLEGHSDPKAAGPVDEPKGTASLNSLSDLHEATPVKLSSAAVEAYHPPEKETQPLRFFL